ncbi:MAG TPA: LPS export ABC transporter periplasmic protein LptC [Lacunisphaera sp.]|nr:LPS export ABC transporter periplasmic protein LptC [Lacunisphaera sp.]
MFRLSFCVTAWFLATTAGWAAGTQLTPDKPIVNFRLPEFTAEGHRSWLVRGSEARYQPEGFVDISGLNLSIFTGDADGKVETLILSPTAQVVPSDQIARGDDSIRVVNDGFEATGFQWTYSHKDKKISIGKNVRVVLRTQLKDILK